MYQIEVETGNIIFPDGFVLAVAYEDERYQDYAAWVQAGNEPEEI